MANRLAAAGQAGHAELRGKWHHDGAMSAPDSAHEDADNAERRTRAVHSAVSFSGDVQATLGRLNDAAAVWQTGNGRRTAFSLMRGRPCTIRAQNSVFHASYQLQVNTTEIDIDSCAARTCRPPPPGDTPPPSARNAQTAVTGRRPPNGPESWLMTAASTPHRRRRAADHLRHCIASER